jgi:hypothetical protein
MKDSSVGRVFFCFTQNPQNSQKIKAEQIYRLVGFP